MSTYLDYGCNNDKAHICDCCGMDDGRPTLYWQFKDFDLCHDCILNLCKTYGEFTKPIVTVSRMTISEETRNKIYKRDNYQCKKCNSKNNLTIDHIFPFIKGGITEESNLQTLCKSCNSSKKAKILEVSNG